MTIEKFPKGEVVLPIRGDDHSLTKAITSNAELMISPESGTAALFKWAFFDEVVDFLRDGVVK